MIRDVNIEIIKENEENPECPDIPIPSSCLMDMGITISGFEIMKTASFK